MIPRRRKSNMVFKERITAALRAYVVYKLEDGHKKARDIAKETGLSLASVYRIRKMNIQGLKSKPRNAGGPGRPKKLSNQTLRRLARGILSLREENPNFCSGSVCSLLGIDRSVCSNRTVRRRMNDLGYWYRQARKKGVLTKKDLQQRLKFAKNTAKVPADFWTSKICFYLDGVSFYYKRNPAGQARSPKGCIWRKANEGIQFGCTAKGRKEGTGGKTLKLFVSISYQKGVISCDPYENLNGQTFCKYVKDNSTQLFTKADKSPSRLWLQDGDPSQNAASVKRMLKKIKANLFSIPARSPDLNPIENLFHLIRKKLDKQAIERNIVKESFAQFQDRVIETFFAFSPSVIDNIIDSMNSRIRSIIDRKGQRLKY